MDRCWEEQSETGAHLWNTLPPIHRAEPFRSFGFIFKRLRSAASRGNAPSCEQQPPGARVSS